MCVEEKSKRVSELVRSSIKDLASLVDVNTVIGKPIVTSSGCRLIPVTKVTFGYLTGGGEYGETKVIKENETAPFAGGNGAVVSLKPSGFIFDDGKTCTFIHAGDDPLDKLIDKASELMGKFADGNA